MSAEADLKSLADRWADVPASERANYQIYLTELAEALDVPRPQPSGSGYEFEYAVQVVQPDGSTTTKFADLYKANHFLLEAKDEDHEETREVLLRTAFAQARLYAAWVDGDPPPYLLVLDVGRTLMVWDRWSGTYGDFHAGRKINLRRLHERPEDIALLRDIWTNPSARDPRGHSAAVTREIADHLAELSATLEERGHDPEEVARFLIRCVFTAFAEDVGLLEGQPFETGIRDIGLDDPEEFEETLGELWKAMDEGGRFGLRKFLRFNGHFFKDRGTISLTREDLVILLEAAEADWAGVEPSIMGTLLTRALDPEERHRLGAEYTPKEYVERLVRPTVEEPIRERWIRVQAEVMQLRTQVDKAESTRKKHEKQALERLREFHEWLRNLRILDPACGSGNFLYVTLDIMKGVELEVLRAIEEITGEPELAVEEVGPWQFHGIEVKAWARELAELTLWIGYHQWWHRTHGQTLPPEPVLRDTGTFEHRDAVLAWDEIQEDPEREEVDPTPRIESPTTGELIPDPEATRAYHEHLNPRMAPWPEADFIVGNPPYLGKNQIRGALGDGYVNALRETYDEVPDSADYVMYWWYRAAQKVAQAETIRAGFITTKAITQTFSRKLIAQAAERGARVCWAVPNHPWVDEADGADVRVAMTVLARDFETAQVIHVDDHAEIESVRTTDELNHDLSATADVAGAAANDLLSNKGLASLGFMLAGRGFIVDAQEVERLLRADRKNAEVLKPLVSGRDLVGDRRDRYVIDFGLRTEEEARQYPALYEIVRERVKPQRDSNKDKSRRENWWLFGRTNEAFREAIAGLSQFIATSETSKHRIFTFLGGSIAPEHKLVCVASDSAYHLGVLSSSIHVCWAVAAGGRLGVGNDPVYVKSRCFEPFPFPPANERLRDDIARKATAILEHRDMGTQGAEAPTLTEIYNVVEKLYTGAELSEEERDIHIHAACGVLRDLHDELDALVSEAYGWEWPLAKEDILEQLVALHDERVVEEERGKVRWLRPEFQIPRFGQRLPEAQELPIEDDRSEKKVAPAERQEWPPNAVDQIAVLQNAVAQEPLNVEEASSLFKGARRDLVERHLETLRIMGEAMVTEDGRYALATPSPAVA